MQTNSNIMANKKYSLAIEKIDEVAKEFIAAHPIYTLCIKDCNQGKQKQIEITNTKSQEKGILNCYITLGQVSHYIQGKQGTLKGICEKCWEYIVEQTAIPEMDQKCFKLKGVRQDDFDALIEAVKEYNNVVVTEVNTEKNPAIRSQYHLKGKYDAKISVIFYNNGTLMVQGSITSFYVEFITEVLQAISSVPSEVIEEVFAIQARAGYTFDNDLNKHISKMEHIRGSVIENFINTSVSLANSAVKVDDYGCYTFGILKALDAVLRTRLLEDAPDFEDYGTYFQKDRNGTYCFKNCVGTYNDNEHLKKALEQGYSFFNQHRHSTFHVDSPSIETSRTLEYDEAVNIIKESLVIINNICNNW